MNSSRAVEWVNIYYVFLASYIPIIFSLLNFDVILKYKTKFNLKECEVLWILLHTQILAQPREINILHGKSSFMLPVAVISSAF